MSVLLKKNENYEQGDVAKRLLLNLAQCESVVQQDVIRRCADWISSGGDLNDQYILNQLQFTDRHLAILRAKVQVDK